MENEELAKLKEIALPEAVSYTPETLAWYILFAVIFLLLLFFLWKRYKRYKKNLYRKDALKDLSNIEKEKVFRELPILVKRVALVFTEREKIASLSDQKWLEFSNTSYNGKGFLSDTGKILIDLSYASSNKISKYTEDEIDALFNLITEWIKKHNA